MSDPVEPPLTFIHAVRTALAHLYDYAFLQNHSLGGLLDTAQTLDSVTRAQKLRRLLLDCVDTLQPDKDAPGAAARACAILTYRYVDGLPVEEIQEKLALSRRQVYREHAKGIEAVASLLWNRLRSEHRAGHALFDADNWGHPAVASPLPASPDGSAVSASQEAATDTSRMALVQEEVARLEQRVHLEALSAQAIIAAIVPIFAPRMAQTGATLQVSHEVWPAVLADRVMLRQALLNLFSYGLECAAPGPLELSAIPNEGSLTVVLQRPAAAAMGGQAGSGQATGAETPPLALAVAHGLINAQGGALRVVDICDGWRAEVRLPLAGSPALLVIDDNAELVALFQRYLAGHRIQVTGLSDSRLAVQTAIELQPRAITLDVMMPDQDGWEVLQALQTTPETADIPVIVCSVLDEPELARSMGASDYLAKPVTQARLLEVLRRWLGALWPSA